MPESIYELQIFKWIEKDTVHDVILRCEERAYWEWKIIISEWEMSNWEWYILKRGKVEISIKGQKIAELNPWDIFGEIALLSDEERTATVKAISDLEVIVISLNNLIEMINNDNNTINKTIIKRIEENVGK